LTDWIEVNGVCLRYDLSGVGPTIVLVHEMGGSLESWDAVLPDLQGLQVLRYDQRGSGLSEKVAAITLEALAADLLALLDALGVTMPVVLAGAALGAALCLHFAINHPDRTRCLVVSSPAPGGANEAARTKTRAWIEAIRLGGMRSVTDMMFGVTYPPGLRADLARFERHRRRWLTNDPESFMATLGMTSSFELVGQLPRIRVPTLVIGCLQDSVRPAARSAELAALIPGSSYAEASSGHYLPLQHPSLFASHLQDFLRSQASTPV
jgi:3-oxoadipate enol-lactonase